MNGLTEGRIVHFIESGSNLHFAAIVVRVVDKVVGIVNLFVFSTPNDRQGGFSMELDVPFSDEKEGRSWHWIEQA